MEALTEREMANNFSEQIKEISSQTLEAWWVGLKQDKYGDSKLNTPEKEKVARKMEWNEGGMDQELGSNNPRRKDYKQRRVIREGLRGGSGCASTGRETAWERTSPLWCRASCYSPRLSNA